MAFASEKKNSFSEIKLPYIENNICKTLRQNKCRCIIFSNRNTDNKCGRYSHLIKCLFARLNIVMNLNIRMFSPSIYNKATTSYIYYWLAANFFTSLIRYLSPQKAVF